MSRENIDRFRRVNDAYNRRDIEAFLEYCDPAIEFHSTFAAVGDTAYRGHAGLRQWHREQQEAWSNEVWSTPEAFFDVGEYTVMFNILGGRGRGSGARVERREAMVARWSHGRIVELRTYEDREQALRDVEARG